MQQNSPSWATVVENSEAFQLAVLNELRIVGKSAGLKGYELVYGGIQSV